MSMLYIVVSCVLIACCVGLNVAILMQNKKASGLTGNLAGMGDSQTYWDKNKGRSKEGTLEKYSKILGALFIILSLALNVIK